MAALIAQRDNILGRVEMMHEKLSSSKLCATLDQLTEFSRFATCIREASMQLLSKVNCLSARGKPTDLTQGFWF
jgi:hypothetical protein